MPKRRHQHQQRDNVDPSRVQTQQDQTSAREVENRRNASRGEIGMIVGGPTDGDSNQARKSHAQGLKIYAVGYNKEIAKGPEISFGPKDLEGVEVPHDDALIIREVIAKYTIHRTFVYMGSSVNIIFKKAFDQLQIDWVELLPMATPLYGFTGNEVLPIEQARLVISLREEPLRRTRTINFIVMDAPSAYNVILGRPTLNEFRTVVSTY